MSHKILEWCFILRTAWCSEPFDSQFILSFSGLFLSLRFCPFLLFCFIFLLFIWISFRCNCPPGYFGALCSLDVNECEASPCLNHGVCINRPGGFTCVCLPGFSGMYVSLPRGDTQSMPQTKQLPECRPLQWLKRHDSISKHQASLFAHWAWLAFEIIFLNICNFCITPRWQRKKIYSIYRD